MIVRRFVNIEDFFIESFDIIELSSNNSYYNNKSFNNNSYFGFGVEVFDKNYSDNKVFDNDSYFGKKASDKACCDSDIIIFVKI